MRAFTAVIERCTDTGLFVGHVPGFPGAHSQGETLDELWQNMTEVLTMLLEDGKPNLESEFVGTQTIQVHLRNSSPHVPERPQRHTNNTSSVDTLNVNP